MTTPSSYKDPVVIHPTYGPAMPSLNWVPAPRYLLRRDRVLRHLEDVAPCRVLDIGCGPGALISELAAKGFEAVGVDESASALALGYQLQSQIPNLQFHSKLDESWKGGFDLLLSLEVLEHIDDDIGALQKWRPYLKTDGLLILTTPAHHKRWNPADEWAGHVRRYERDELKNTLEAAGFAVEAIECYGFPLANLLDVISAPIYRKRLQAKLAEDKNSAQLTAESGSDRAEHVRFWPTYGNPVAACAMSMACKMQGPFVRTNLGPGLLAIARLA